MKVEVQPLHDTLAATLWPDEWLPVAGVEDRPAQNKRRLLRERARKMLEDACRLTSTAAPEAATAVEKPQNVTLATEADSFGLLVLIQESDKEQAITARDYGKVREVIDMATDRTPITDADGAPFMRPVFGVIVADGVVEAACGMFPTQPWDSWETYLRGFFLYTGLASRQKNHAKNLLQWSNWFANRSQMVIMWEVMHCRPLDDRSRLFLRHAAPLGSFFIHRPVEVAA